MKNQIDDKKIEQAITDFESAVDFEFVPVIARKSSYVEHISWVLSLLFLIVFILLIDLIFLKFFSDSWISKDYFYLGAPILAITLGTLLDKSDWVDRFCISSVERQRQVQEKAELIFFRKHLSELKSQNALLLFISVMERKIILLPDPRLKFEHMQEINQELLKIIQASFKQQEFEQGLLNAIAHLKLRLEPHFGYKAGVTKSENMVANKLIWWDD